MSPTNPVAGPERRGADAPGAPEQEHQRTARPSAAGPGIAGRRAGAVVCPGGRGRQTLAAGRRCWHWCGASTSAARRRWTLRRAVGVGRPTTGPRGRRIVATAQQPPTRRQDGTATWSLMTLQRALRQPGAFPRLGATTIRRVLEDAGSSYQRTRTWCPTGTAQRKRTSGVVRVTDPQTERKRGRLSKRTAGRRRRG